MMILLQAFITLEWFENFMNTAAVLVQTLQVLELVATLGAGKHFHM